VDSIRLSLLEAEIKAQLDKIEQVFALLEARTTNFQPDNPGSVESVAYQLHNVYNAIEYLMEIVALDFIRVEQNLHKARQVRSLVARDTALFLKALQIDKS
jgi:hypothetical protein